MIEPRNPFLIYGYHSPAYFCDREAETQKLISALRNGRNVTLMSPRRMGKTGLIKQAFYLMQQEDKNVACFYLDIYSTKDLTSFVSLFANTILGKIDTLGEKVTTGIATFFKTLRPVLGTDPITGALTASIDFKPQQAQNTLAEVFEYLKQSGRECYIAIDEFQQVAEYPEQEGVEGLLRSYIQFCPNVHFVFSGSRQHLMSEIFDSPNRPFYRSTQKLTLGTIDVKNYYLFAAHLMSKAGITLPQEVFHNLYQRFDGHTWYVQNLLNHIYEVASPQVSKQVVDECLQEIILSEADDFARLYRMLTANQAQLLHAIALEGVVPAINASQFITSHHLKGTSSINKALDFLIAKEYVYSTDQGYIVYDRFMGLWLQTI